MSIGGFESIRTWVTGSESAYGDRYLWVCSRKDHTISWKKRETLSWLRESSSLIFIFSRMATFLQSQIEIKNEEQAQLLLKLKARAFKCYQKYNATHRIFIISFIYRLLFGDIKKVYENLETHISKHLNHWSHRQQPVQISKSKQENKKQPGRSLEGKTKPKTLKISKLTIRLGDGLNENVTNPHPPAQRNIQIESTPSDQLVTKVNTPVSTPPVASSVERRSSSSQMRASVSTIHHDYMVGGRSIAHQTISRFESVDQDVELCQSMLVLLRERERNKELLREDARVELNVRIRFYTNELAKAQRLKGKNQTWLNSNYFRHLIQSQESYQRAADDYLSAPINMRYQELRIEQVKQVGFFRVGVISDMRNGWFSIKDLRKMKIDPKKVQTFYEQIDKINKKGSKRLNQRQKESIAYALAQLSTLKQSMLDKTFASTIDALILERKLVLEKQMLHLLNAQIEQNLDKIKVVSSLSREFNMVHGGLLNLSRSELTETGWMHDERVEVEDMHAIFEAFRGKKLIFDGTGPAIDGDYIHLPHQIEGMDSSKVSCTLNTYFFNISVQGPTKNDVQQADLNTSELKQLKLHFKDLFKTGAVESDADYMLQNYLVNPALVPDKKKGYPLAEEFLTHLLKFNQFAVSTGCLSAKDRTGLVAELLMLLFLPDPYQKHKEFIKQIVDAGHPAIRVVRENTGAKFLKLNPKANLPGIDDLSIKDKLTLLGKFITSIKGS